MNKVSARFAPDPTEAPVGGIHNTVENEKSRQRRAGKPSASKASTEAAVLGSDPEPRRRRRQERRGQEHGEVPAPRPSTGRHALIEKTAAPDESLPPTKTSKTPKAPKRTGRLRVLMAEVALFTAALAGAGLVGAHRTRLPGLALVIVSLTAVYLIRKRRSVNRWGTATAFAALTFALIGGLVVTMAPDGPLRSLKAVDMGSWVKSAVVRGITMKSDSHPKNTMPMRAPMTPEPEREPAVPAFSAPVLTSPTGPTSPIPQTSPIPPTPPIPQTPPPVQVPPPPPPPAPASVAPPAPTVTSPELPEPEPFNEPPPEQRRTSDAQPSDAQPSDRPSDRPSDTQPSDGSSERSSESKKKTDRHSDDDDDRAKKSDDDSDDDFDSDSDFDDLARSFGGASGNGTSNRSAVDGFGGNGGKHSGTGFGGAGGNANGAPGASSNGQGPAGNGGGGGQGGQGGTGFGS